MKANLLENFDYVKNVKANSIGEEIRDKNGNISSNIFVFDGPGLFALAEAISEHVQAELWKRITTAS